MQHKWNGGDGPSPLSFNGEDCHIESSPQHYSSMVDMLGRAGKLEEAEELMSQIPRQPGFSLLQSLLGACRIHGNVEMAERVADTLMRLEPMESGSFFFMSNLYAEKGDWEMVAKVGKWRRDKGVRKEVGYSWVDTGDFHPVIHSTHSLGRYVEWQNV
ncbi:pentatricopeptide repeat-containing protein [Prunus yedoensis var. nudiflora]|uniref:Pentatricopeptide repeat-containing protein n=1 Tax=Prunus yedoensis var. nudiflora TaxID=2094558 RepID=A0A314ULR3_PRUYE|nr:pentatricopeptide repeat-containing protein [Prunus yedoensis var. nudiflora]